MKILYIKLRKPIFTGISYCLLPLFISAQTQPSPQTVTAIAPYTQNFDSFDGSNTVDYPAGWQGWQVANSVPSSGARTTAPVGDRVLTTNGSAVSGATGVYDFNGKIGLFSNNSNDIAISLALNTTNITSPNKVKVSFDAMVIRNLYNGSTNNIINSLVLQYRIGTGGDFINVNNTVKNGTSTQTTGTNGIDIKNYSFVLPAECSNQPVLHLRWIFRTVSGSAGSRPSLALDNVTVSSEAPAPVAPFRGYEISSKNITTSNSRTYATNVLDGVTHTEALSSYGGSLADYVGNTTGYFTVYKDNRDTWYMVDPAGYKFYSIGVNTILPGGGVDPVNQIKSIYANTIANFSDESITNMPYCVRLNLGQEYKNTTTRTRNLYDNGILPVFDPAFITFSNSLSASLITPSRVTDKNLVGYFSDNEVPLANAASGQNFITRWLDVSKYGGQANADADPNYNAAVNWIKSRNGGVFRTPTTADKNEWPGYVAGRYYQVCRDAIKAADPNHLYIGSRLHQDLANRYLFEAAGLYTDVISVNNYNVWSVAQLDARYDVWEQYGKKPFIIGEFYAQAADSGLPNTTGAGWNVETQQDRADFFEHYTMELLKRKLNVGFQYFKYRDDPGANNKGLLNTDYEWWEPMKKSFTEISQDVYRLREFLLYGEQTLPITLKSFTAKTDGEKVKLEWVTTAEIDNDRFEIQRSADGDNFKTIYSIKGKENAGQLNNYLSYDYNPLNGDNYYKLVQYDHDGKSKEHGIRTVNFKLNQQLGLKIYPNPVQDVINIQITNYLGNAAEITLQDINGRIVHKETINTEFGESTYQLNLNTKLKTGQYILNYSGAGIKKTAKLIVL